MHIERNGSLVYRIERSSRKFIGTIVDGCFTPISSCPRLYCQELLDISDMLASPRHKFTDQRSLMLEIVEHSKEVHRFVSMFPVIPINQPPIALEI